MFHKKVEYESWSDFSNKFGKDGKAKVGVRNVLGLSTGSSHSRDSLRKSLSRSKSFNSNTAKSLRRSNSTLATGKNLNRSNSTIATGKSIMRGGPGAAAGGLDRRSMLLGRNSNWTSTRSISPKRSTSTAA